MTLIWAALFSLFGSGCAVVVFWFLLFCACTLVISQKFRTNKPFAFNLSFLKRMPKAKSPFSFEVKPYNRNREQETKNTPRTPSSQCALTGADCQATPTKWAATSESQTWGHWQGWGPPFCVLTPKVDIASYPSTSYKPTKILFTSCLQFNYISHYNDSI